MVLDVSPFFRAWAAWRRRQLLRLDPVESQRQTLMSLVHQATGTRFGHDHAFGRIQDVADFQEFVPLRKYEDFWRDYWSSGYPMLKDCTWPGQVPYFALSSGTSTGRTKYIPVSAAMRRSNMRAALDVMVHHFAARPSSRPMAGKTFMLGGSTALEEPASGIFAGDLSGIATKTMPGWARPITFPGEDLAYLADWEEKIERMAQASLKEDIRVLTGTPSWLVLLLERVTALAGGPPPYPDLDLVVHGGIAFGPYRHRFAELLAGTQAELREVYPASEGFFASADRSYGEGLRMNVDHGLFYEFVPVEELDSPTPRRHWLATAERGIDYALVITSCAGLWAYVVGDTVQLVDLDPPRLLVTGRTSYGLSAFGEHLIGAEIEAAITFAAERIGADVADFTVGPLFPDENAPRGRHRWLVEFTQTQPSSAIATFTAALDSHLCDQNDDYRVHRTGAQLDEPEVTALAAGTFNAWMKSRGRLGGQNKVPRVIADPDTLGRIVGFCQERMTGSQRD